MSSLTAKQILTSAFVLFRTGFPHFIWPVLPVLLVSEAVGFATGNPASWASFSLVVAASFVLGTIAGAVVLAALLRLQFPGADVVLSLGAVVRLLFVEIYLGAVTALAGLLLVLPALWVAAATIVAPVSAFWERKSPFAAAAFSVGITKGHIRPIFLAGAAYFVTFMLVGIAVEYLPQPLQFVASLSVSIAGLYCYALMVVVFAHLHPNPNGTYFVSHA